MSETSARDSQDRRLRFLRFGLLAITGVAFAVKTAVNYFLSGGTGLWAAVLQGLLWGVIVGVVSIIIYFVYKATVAKA